MVGPRDHGAGTPLYFVCYSREERDLVEKIEAKLAARRRRKELDLWRDVRNLDVWEEFTPEVLDALTRAAGAIVVVSDSWYASDYIQSHEWPTILDRYDDDRTFGIFPLAVTGLDDDDPLRAHNFVNDLREERLLGCGDVLRDTVLTRLSNQMGAHARSVTAGASAAPSVRPALASTALPVTTAPPTPADCGELRRGLHGVPELPAEFVEPAELLWVCERLGQGAVTGITGVLGEGGTGKTILAAAVARRLVSNFPSGVLWVTVGEHATTEDVRRLQADLLSSLVTDPDRPPRDHNDGKELLRVALAGRAALVVVDDVWHPWQGSAFEVVEPGGPARLLFTTRFPEVLSVATERAEVTRLGPTEAAAFLRRLPAGLPSTAKHVAEVLDAAGRLRLALAVLSATARLEKSWDPVLARLDGLANRFGRGDDASSAQKALHVALDTLSASDRERAWTLRAFPLDAVIPVTLLADLWEISVAEARELVGRLLARTLVSGAADTVELHDHVHDFLALEAPVPVSAVHIQLWELAERRADGDWRALAEREPYLWDRLVWHGTRAGLNSATLRGVVSDLRWLATRIRGQGSAAAEQDIRRVCDTTALEEGTPLRCMQRVLRHGGMFDAIAEDAGLDLSLECWADSVGIKRPGPRRLRSGSLPVPGAALMRTLRGHTNGVVGVAFHPQDGRVATASADGTVRIWDPQTGQAFATLTGHTGGVSGVAFDPQGGRVATGGRDRTARIWDSETGQSLATLTGHTHDVVGVAFDPDGRRVATASWDGTACIWDSETGEALATLTGHTSAVTGVAFHPTGRRIATGSADGTARIWDSETGQSLVTLTGHTSWVSGVAFDPPGGRVATASWDGTARIWDSETGEALATLSGHTSGVWGVAFDPPGGRVATASWDGTARIWDSETGDALDILIGHTTRVWAVAFDSQGAHVATASEDGTARIWDSETGDALDTLTRHTSGVSRVTFDPQGRASPRAAGTGQLVSGTPRPARPSPPWPATPARWGTWRLIPRAVGSPPPAKTERPASGIPRLASPSPP